MVNKNCLFCNALIFRNSFSKEYYFNIKKFCTKECYKKSIRKGILRGAKCSWWHGDNVSYNGLHKWIRRNFGKAKQCDHCGILGIKGKRNWNIDWANVSGNYSRERKDWKGLCRKCHIKHDKENTTNKTITISPHKTVFIHEIIN